MIFPRLSPSGAHWCAEGLDGSTHTVVVDGRTIARQGIQPAWLDEDRIVFSDTHTPHVWCIARDGVVLDGWDTPAPVNRLQAHGGHWLGWMPAYLGGAGGYSLDGVSYQATQEPALQPSGGLWYPCPTCIEPRATLAGEAAVNHGTRPPTIWPDRLAPWPGAVCHWAVPVWTPFGDWILRLEDTRVVLHPSGDSLGYVVAEGISRWPDARWHDAAQAVRVVWSTEAGVIESRHVELDGRRVELRDAPPMPTPPEEPSPMPDYREFRWDRCHVYRDAPDIGEWPITSEPGLVTARDGAVRFEHSQAGAWPTVPYGDIVVEGCIWTVAPDGDGWRAATWDRLRPGQTEKGMEATGYREGYALDFDWTPKDGDVVGYLVSTPARMDERGPVNERSRIAWAVFGASTGPLAVEGGPISPPTDPEPSPDPPTPPGAPGAAEWAALTARVARLEAWAQGLALR